MSDVVESMIRRDVPLDFIEKLDSIIRPPFSLPSDLSDDDSESCGSKIDQSADISSLHQSFSDEAAHIGRYTSSSALNLTNQNSVNKTSEYKQPRAIKDASLCTATATAEEDNDNLICVVCFRPQSEPDDVIILCDGPCGSAVHQGCYGLKRVPRDDFFCDACLLRRSGGGSSSSSRIPLCILCHSENGLMKRTECGLLTHTICVLFCSELTVNSSLAANNISSLDAARGDLVCCECRKVGGGVAQCAFGDCVAGFHPYCSYASGQLLLIRASVQSQPSSSWDFSQGSLQDSCVDYDYQLFCPSHAKYTSHKRVVSATLEMDTHNGYGFLPADLSRMRKEPTTAKSPEVRSLRTANLDIGSTDYLADTQSTGSKAKPLHVCRKRLRRMQNKEPGEEAAALEKTETTVVSVKRQLLQNIPVKERKVIAMKYFEHEAVLSGSDDDGGSEGDDQDVLEADDYDCNDSFINDGEYTQDDKDAESQTAMYYRLNNKRFSSKDGGTPSSTSDLSELMNMQFRGAERGLPIIARLLARELQQHSQQSQGSLFSGESEVASHCSQYTLHQSNTGALLDHTDDDVDDTDLDDEGHEVAIHDHNFQVESLSSSSSPPVIFSELRSGDNEFNALPPVSSYSIPQGGGGRFTRVKEYPSSTISAAASSSSVLPFKLECRDKSSTINLDFLRNADLDDSDESDDDW